MKLLALGAAAVAMAALTLTPATASADELPAFDFSDCPAPPSNADPGTWRCESFVSQGKLTIGDEEIPLGEMRLAFSEGRVNGQYAQVFGALRHTPVRVPGLAGTTIQLRYGGYSDFQGNDVRRGELDVYAVLRHPLLRKECSIGTAAAPLHTVVHDDPALPPTVLSKNPPTFHFGVVDPDLALPATQGCGPLGKLVDRKLGLPSPSGQNTFHQTTYVQYKPL
ncbi:hypothetical protein DMA12_04200 [Amycolatopsis balhimycina DSM 5908]|uniref:Secreted protein n=1 Tax=Amycolatopsis balhimycina DSM 5908 TaxID=1081091 RepID=A0A428X2Q6_AMYBA|nr:hypothetical protein [Amycolatopsis balhimycina]RSM49625.1 hypothetical protein DMA12_04200 [Amycolatopsis balhimycina DSM 5908]